MFTKGQIRTWLELFELSDNKIDFLKYNSELKPGMPPDRVFLKRDLVEAKVQTDRWNVVTTDWIFHVSKKPVIEYLFREERSAKSPEPDALREALMVITRYAAVLEKNFDLKGRSVKDLTDEEVKDLVGEDPLHTREDKYIWGAKVHFTEDIDPNTGIGLALESDGITLWANDSDKMANSIIVFPVWDDPPKK